MEEDERNYVVHEKEILDMKCAPAKFCVYLLGYRPFIVLMDHASSRTDLNRPHFSQEWRGGCRSSRIIAYFREIKTRTT